jgi:hypothetical protein
MEHFELIDKNSFRDKEECVDHPGGKEEQH